MQLTSSPRKSTLVLAFAAISLAAGARADGGVDLTTSLYHDAGGGLKMTVLTPSLTIDGTIADALTLRAGYEADIVSGASVAVVDAPGGAVDAITSATTLNDIRHTASAGFTLHSDFADLSVDYAYGTESDYQSHGFSVSAHSELFERNTTFDISYARGFDRACALNQPRAQEAVDRQRLPSSTGCFSADDRTYFKLDLSTFQGSWTQAWAPVFTTQFTLTAQILNGFQGSPYRAVWLGRSAAMENPPENRARYAAGLSARLWVKPLHGALQLSGRVYRDSWDLRSVTAEGAYEQTISGGLRLRGRVRFYDQTAAVFFSDNYVRQPRGQYFTGDRELSSMRNITYGLRLVYDLPPGEDGDVLGIFDGFRIVAKADLIRFDFRAFHYGGADVPNTDALALTLGLTSRF
ncbi:MAG: DUF3570 domain-containing protein [Deltaproteobacteria bacterium]|nr:DUF3570 domain-containing protein [Deltaproteobacteria bacterium]